jgi:RNA polymerase sigma-70 factor (ECF subfamily)
MDLRDGDIILKLNAGNRETFEFIFKKFYSLLCYEARSYIKSEDLIEEIVCDVFTRIWLNREALEIKTSLRDYLVKAVHNNCIDYYRQLKRQKSFIADSEESDIKLNTLLDLGEDPLNYILTKELEDKILKSIDTLPPQYQRAFKLSRFKDKTYEEIAAEMQISVNSVKTNIKNALAILRKELSGFFILAFAYLLKCFS